MSITVNGTNGLTFNDGSAQNTAATGFGFKNRIINGAMAVWQRGTSATGTYSAGPTSYTTADRWVYYSASSMTSSQSSSVPSGFQYSLKVQRPNAAVTTNQIYAFQVIESVNMLDLAGQSVTLSFWAKAGANFSASGSTLVAVVNTGTTADQGSASGLGGWTGGAQPLSLSQAITTTWTRYSVTGTIASNALELDVAFYYTPTGTAGADDAFYITGVQLEKGSTATSYDYRPYGTELALCQRYYETLFGYVPITTGTEVGGVIYYKVEKRASGTVTLSRVAGTNANSPSTFTPSTNSVGWYVGGNGWIQISGTANSEL